MILWRKQAGVAALVLMLFFATARCGMASGLIAAVGIENQYADIIHQIGGNFVSVTAIITNPNTDPHTFEVSPKIVGKITSASLIVENGLGYDAWANKIIEAAPSRRRRIINVQHLLGFPNSAPNPHFWYDPKAIPVVAKAIAHDLATLDPAHAAYFDEREHRFDDSLQAWTAAITSFKTRYPDTPVAVTEPVADYMLQALGAHIETPFTLQLAIMNGTDPSPQDIAAENALLREHKVKAFVYNRQVMTPLTESFLNTAKKNGVPVVAVYETMPTPGYDFQSWMLAEIQALTKAVAMGTSTESLLPASAPPPTGRLF